MKPAASLNLPEREPRATTSAREAARRAGMTVATGRPPTAVEWQANLQRAIAEIAARQRELDGEAARMSVTESSRQDAAGPARAEQAPATPDAFDMSRLERQLRTITEQLESLRRPGATEEALVSLQRELADFGRRLNDALPRNVLESFQSEIRALGERIEVGARQGGDRDALAGIERGLGDIRRALDALTPAENLSGFAEAVQALSRRIDTIGASGSDPQMLQQLERAVSELRTVSGQIASGESVSALAEQIRTLGDSLRRFTAEADRVVDIEQKGIEHVEQLAQRVEALSASIESRTEAAPVGAPAEFEQLVKALAERFDGSHPLGADHLTQLEQRILLLAQKLDASEARLGALSGIEDNIVELMGQLKGARTAAIEAAESAARSVAEEMLHARVAGSEGAFAELRQDVAELRSTQIDVDRRTAGALEAVHDTLKRLVDQMASVDMGPQPPAIGRPEPQPASPLRRTSGAAAPLAAASAAPVDSRLTPGLVAAAVPPRARREPPPSLPDDHPLEPGSGSPRRIAVTPAERIAASEAALAAAQPQGPGPSAQASFIAAARRAAIAAAEGTPAPGGAAGASAASRLRWIAPSLLKWRRELIIGTAVIVVALGMVQLVTRVLPADQEAMDGPLPRPDAEVMMPAPPALDGRRSAAPLALSPRAERPETRESLPGAVLHDDGWPAATNRPSQAPPDSGSLLSPSMMGSAGANGHGPGAHEVPGARSALESDAGRETAPWREATGSLGRSRSAGESDLEARPPVATPAPKLPESIGGPALRAAAAADDPAAAFEVAIRYAEGRGVPQSLEEAARWLDRAASHGLAPAQFRLGSLYEKGQGVTKDLKVAQRLYAAAAAKGNGKAMHNLAVLYAEGIDGKPDYQAAAQWFRTAAERGVADSQYNLAIFYARGIGVDQNLTESYKWFALAAQHGDNDAARKRDEIGARVDPQSLAAARVAIQAWTAVPQPDDATTVKAPPGGWDVAGSAPAPARSLQPGAGQPLAPAPGGTHS